MAERYINDRGWPKHLPGNRQTRQYRLGPDGTPALDHRGRKIPAGVVVQDEYFTSDRYAFTDPDLAGERQANIDAGNLPEDTAWVEAWDAEFGAATPQEEAG